MSTNHTAAAPTRGLLATEARLFAREPGWLFWILLFPSLLLGVLGLVPSFREPDPELADCAWSTSTCPSSCCSRR